MEQLQSTIGGAALVGLAWALSSARKDAPWRFAAAGLGVAFALAAFATWVPFALNWLQSASVVVNAIQGASDQAARFVFGHVAGGPAPYEVANPGVGLSIAFQILPVVIVSAALAALLDHWGVLGAAIRAIGWALQRSIGVSGPLGFAAGASFFFGVAEAPLFLRRQLQRMSRADLFAVVTLGLSTVSGVVFVLYATTLSPVAPEAVAHILAASAISLPTALAIARIMEPPSKTAAADATVEDGARAEEATSEPERRYANSVDALAQGGVDGMRLFLNIVAILIVVVATVALLDDLLALFGEVSGAPLTARRIAGWAFAPVTFLVGIPWSEAAIAGELFATKAVLNEFFAYLALAATPSEALSPRSVMLLLYALCGFANFGSIGIMIAAFSTIAPHRRAELAQLAFRAWIAGNLTTALTGAMIGVLTPAG